MPDFSIVPDATARWWFAVIAIGVSCIVVLAVPAQRVKNCNTKPNVDTSAATVVTRLTPYGNNVFGNVKEKK
ncbi:MAG: hypothetical protein IIC50_18415 [Planctomycetes bacterium]|nr:hypothetical protein [Planctomycetota bacterium]